VETKAGVFWSKVALVTSGDRFLVDGVPNAAAREMSRDLRQASVAAKISVLSDDLGYVNKQLGNDEAALKALTNATLIGNDEAIRKSAMEMLRDLP